jgi:hypothetical protein
MEDAMVGPSDDGKHFDGSGIPTLAEVRARSAERSSPPVESARDIADKVMSATWQAMRNDRRLQPYANGAIEMALALRAFDAEHAELWSHRLNTCPGHEDEGGRDWCAYCGPLPKGS